MTARPRTGKPSRRNLVWAAAVVLALAALDACTSLVPRDVTLSTAQLQALLDRQFPREQRVLDVIDMRLSRPVVRLLPERNRIATDVELSAAERITGRGVRGRLALDYALRYEPADASLRLSNVHVQSLDLDVGGTVLAGQGARLGGLLAERLLDDFVVYRVDERRRAWLAEAGISSADIAVTSNGVELHFPPPR